MNETPEYKFLNIKTNQFAFLDSDYNKDCDELQIKNSYSYGINKDNGVFLCVHSCSFMQDDKTIMKIETQATFQLNEASMKIFIKGDNFVMPTNVVKHFTSMLYGATRGILVCKLEGTRFASLVLPPVNLAETITKPLSISLCEE